MNHCCFVHGSGDFRISLQVSDIWGIGRFDVLTGGVDFFLAVAFFVPLIERKPRFFFVQI